MKKMITALLGICLCQVSQAELWQDSTSTHQTNQQARSTIIAKTNQVGRFSEARLLDLNIEELKDYLQQAPLENSGASTVSLTLPLPKGKYANYWLYQSPVMEPALAAKYPEIQTFRAVDRSNPLNTARLDLTPAGFHAMLMHDGMEIFIDPIGDNHQYQSYYKADYARNKRQRGNHQPFVCRLHQNSDNRFRGALLQERNEFKQARLSFGQNITTYRLAMAANGEFTVFHGGTKAKALAAIVTGVNRINQVYERDLAIKLELVNGTDQVIYEDPNTDPFTSGELAEIATQKINESIGVANYDVGHAIGGSGSTAAAALGVICNDQKKADGETSSNQPINDPFFIDYVSHELGHQFGSEHSFNGTSGSCDENRLENHAFEPGSGSTIMGYTGICDEEDLQPNSDAYFHNDSIDQIKKYLATSVGSSCGTPKSIGNALPVVDAGSTGTIPAQTPFILTGSASDSDGDPLTYAWEQRDLGPSTNSKIYTDDGKRPLFRSFTPNSSASRSFPKLSDILSGTSSYGEMLPTTSRDLNFTLTVRDGKGGVVSANRKLVVSNQAGPFKVTTTNNTPWTPGEQTITWDVANTTTAPINCSKVDISLSSDGGQSFTTELVSGSNNDGSQIVKIPDISTSQARIRVMCSSQPFFAINAKNIIINGGGSDNTVPVAVNDTISIKQSPNTIDLKVLNNDSDNDEDALTITKISNIDSGFTIGIAADKKSISFKHPDNYTGTTQFSYTISDGKAEASAEVSVTVTAAETSTNNSDGGGGTSDLYFVFVLMLLGSYRLRVHHS